MKEKRERVSMAGIKIRRQYIFYAASIINFVYTYPFGKSIKAGMPSRTSIDSIGATCHQSCLFCAYFRWKREMTNVSQCRIVN